MTEVLKPVRYIDYKIYNVTSIKKKYGFRLVLQLDDGSNRTIQHAGYEKKEQAEKDRCRIIGMLENRTYVVYTKVTVKEYLEYWYEYDAPKRLKAYNSFLNYRNAIFNHIIPRIGNVKLVNLTSGIISKLYEEVKEYSVHICEIVKTVITSALADAKKNMFVPTNEAVGIKIPKTDKEKELEATVEQQDITYHTLLIDERKTFTIEQVATIIKASMNTPIYMHVLFATLMGLRKSEINAIKYSDIDFINKKLFIKFQLRKKT